MSKHAKFADFNRFNIFRSQMPETMYHQYKSTFGVKVEGKGGSEASSCENFDFVVEWCNKALKKTFELGANPQDLAYSLPFL